MKRLLKYIDFYQRPENVNYNIFEVQFQRDLFECGLVDLKWDQTFSEYGQQQRSFENPFTDQEIQNANIEMLGAMLTYLHRGITHYSQSNLLDYKDLFIKLLKRLENILSNSKKCESCSRIIDSNSNFCKYCGYKVKYSNNSILIEIFQGIYKSLFTNSEYTKEEFDNEFEKYKNFQNRDLSDNDYYQILVDVIFYSGFRASTVDKHIDIIHSYFNDYTIVSKYDFEMIEKIKNDSRMIRNHSKIEACVYNAKKVNEIVECHGSFKRYINSFEPNANEECLFRFKHNLEKTFRYVSQITSYHFMTDIGLNVLKPDRVILRILSRLGLIENESDSIGAVKMGRLFSSALDFPIRYIDIILVSYGQLNLPNLTCICSEKNPKCSLCGANNHCRYSANN